MAKELQVILVRLCECEGNVSELVSRHGSLTERGKNQAIAVKTRLKEFQIQSWFAPQNSACQETAQVLSGGTVEKADEFKEPLYPQWAGRTLSEVKERWPLEWNAYWHPQPGDADRVIVPDGETFRTTFQRAKRGLNRIFGEFPGGGAVGIVTHGEIIRLLTIGFLGAPLEHLFLLHGKNGGITVFKFDGAKAVFECINDTCHLSTIGTDDLANYVTNGE